MSLFLWAPEDPCDFLARVLTEPNLHLKRQEPGEKNNTGFLWFPKNVWGEPYFFFFFLNFRGFHQPANIQKLHSNTISFLRGVNWLLSPRCRVPSFFSLSFLAISLQVSESGAVSTMAFLTLLLSPWRHHGNLSSERAQRGSISTRLISPHTRLAIILSPRSLSPSVY